MSSRDIEPQPKKKSRHKVALEPIGLDEILSGPGMSGFVSILDPREEVPHLQSLVDEIKEAPGAKRVPGVERDTGPVGQGHALSRAAHGSPKRECAAPRVRRALAAQDGHSSGEEILYQALWHCPHAKPETPETRLVTMGWKVMAKIARLTPRNTRRNCESLIRKLAVEPVAGENCRENIGRTYRLFSYEAIVERRRAAGLEWVTRTRGVAFVPGPGGQKGTGG